MLYIFSNVNDPNIEGNYNLYHLVNSVNNNVNDPNIEGNNNRKFRGDKDFILPFS